MVPARKTLPAPSDELDQLVLRVAEAPADRLYVLQQLLGEPRAVNSAFIPFRRTSNSPWSYRFTTSSQWVRKLLDRVQAVPVPKEIILVDDFSTDVTRDILKELEEEEGIRVVYQPCNQGKGAALREGFRHASGDVVIVQDADLEYDPGEYPRLIQPILEDRADVVFGSRFIGESHRVLYYWHYVCNKMLTMASNMFTNLNLTDMETCYKVFRREVLDGLELKSNRFGFEPEVTAKIAKRRCWRIYEVPISYSGRTYEEGKKIGLKDAFNALYCIIRYGWFD